ncbi:MAG: sugar ABC transporter substrate-binding protein [Lachnospiraceae bacterium]|nr:sugar ABC transporter substrate-binding protein [Lachnospiraceae bacterium]
MKKRMLMAAAAIAALTVGMTAAASDETATLRVLNWGSTEEETVANDAIARFNEEYPNVTVEQTCVPVDSWSDFIQKWITMLTSGEAPDVINFGLEGAQMAVSNDLLMSLNEIVESDEVLNNLVENEYAESLLDGFTVDDTLYGLPSGTQTMVIYYNKNFFDEKGIDYPSEGWTWDDFMEIASELTYVDDEGNQIYGFGLSSSYFQLTPWWVTNSASLVDEDGNPSLNSEAMVESVEFLYNMVTEGITPDPISSDVYTMFSSGQLAMVGAGRWCLNTWQDAGLTSDDFDSVQWPMNTEAGTVYGGSAWGVSSTTENSELAIALLKEMVSNETLTATAAYGQQIPPTETLATDTEIMGTVPDNILGLWEAITIGSPIDAPSYFGDLEQGILRGLENVFSGEMSVQDALDQAQGEVESAIG